MTRVRLGGRRPALVVVLAAAAALAAWVNSPRRSAPLTPPATGGPLVIALAGDAAVSVPFDPLAPAIAPVGALLQDASLALANFEAAASGSAASAMPDRPAEGAPRWPAAVPEAASALKRLGIGAVALANNHAFDSGVDGLAHTQAQLDAVGIAHAGAGANRDGARQPAFVTTRQGAVALVAVTLSAAAGSRATARQGDINGRPGVNALRFSRRLTVDGAALGALAAVFPPALLKPRGDGTWDLLGVTVTRGTTAGMSLEAEPDDVSALAAAVRDARASGATVVVSLHAHEPGNRVDAVPALLRDVAHAAIDAGADIVYGHGPHRLRGVELYRGRPVFYSLGNLVFPARLLRPESADEFEDHGRDVLSPFESEAAPQLDFADDVWWQSAVAVVRFAGGVPQRIELHPIDLGVGRDVTGRGLPAQAETATGAAILDRLRGLSEPLGTRLVIENGVGVVLVRDPPAGAR